MKSRTKLCLKTAWLTTATVLLFMGTNLCVSTDSSCFAAGETMLLFMTILSFPMGVVFVFASIFFLGTEGVHSPSDYITVWLIMACGGLLQWFIVIPRLFAKRDFTTLNLRQEDLPLKGLLVGDQPTSARAPKRIKPISAFDNRGRTPLERVIARLS